MTSAASTGELAAAYADCRAIARREAKNFYYGFVALPRAKKDAMCAVYAFMRRADDIADNEEMPVMDRRRQLADWLQSFQSSTQISVQDRPIFLAVRDVQRRFAIDDLLLQELVQGTSMDLAEEIPAGVLRLNHGERTLDAYKTQEALEQYCYFVASVVGLVTIRIFGFTGPESEVKAIAMGKAFQLTNILRDVKEDADRGRIYVPLEVLERHGSGIQDVLDAAAGGKPSASLIAAMRDLGERSEQYYEAKSGLIADLAADSRGAMRTLIDIYQALLHRIFRAQFQVFSTRIRVPTSKKLMILARGMLTRVAL